jgi:bifunctional non-homologous end joining protein LigD
MGLKEYRKKRDFQRTPEPQGREESTAPGRGLYVIQKHAASRLHYDLRLEMDGVLKSWAVPKGPSLDPAEKRLAVQVEDHPLEYGGFEGTIPKGEYGGGTVMLWDRGTWEAEGDPAKEFPNGKLSFRLHGQKLRGSWALARMRERDGQPSKNWLLIKHKDNEAVAEERYRVVEAEPLSVASLRTMDEIAAGVSAHPAPAVLSPTLDPGQLTKARPAPLPESFSPQLASLAAQPPEGDQWLHEIKFDGYRIVATINAGQVTLRSRNGKEWTARFPGIVAALQRLPVQQAILDGEIVVLRPDATSDFQALQEFLGEGRAATPLYYLFDLPYCNGYDLTGAPLLERKQLLQTLLARLPPTETTLRFSDHFRGGGAEVYRQACGLAAEGIVSKRAEAVYEQKRSRNWLKAKCRLRQEFVVGGWTDPAGSRSGFGALLLGYYQGGELIFAGRVGSGFTVGELQRLSGRLMQLAQAGSPFPASPAAEGHRVNHWVRPELVVEVEFREWTREGLLRQAAFLGLREDKAAGEIVREAPAAGADNHSPGQSASPATPPGKSAATVVVAGVRVSHPDKILYPEQGVSKRDLANFYAAIGDFILPHIRRRPLTLVRCPDGHQGECFYQKHLKEALPASLRTVPIREKSATTPYPVLDGLPGLIALVQLGVLEIHPWGSREDDLERPDLLTFDLDPGPGLAWQQVIEGAQLLRHRLGQLGLTAFVKTSGGKGLHLVVPIEPRAGWEEAKGFARAVALDLVRSYPERFTAESKKAKRAGKIFIDYLRNGRGATTVAAYSTRARAGAPVSTPITWEELDQTMTPDRYRIDNLPRRLAGLKHDPWGDYFTARQELKTSWQAELEI